MSAESTAASVKAEPKAHRAVLWGSLVAGTLDISAAFADAGLRGAGPIRVLQGIASGLLGPDSFRGGFRTAALGVVLHFFIAFVACAVYFAASRKLRFLAKRAVVCGLLYGVAVYLFMYGVVLPLTFHRSFFNSIRAVVTSLAIHMLFVGLPISLIVRRYSSQE